MDQSRFGIWAQVIGNVAVVVGIAILIYEVNQNKQLINAQIIQADLSPIADRQAAKMGDDPRSALFKVEFCPDELTGEEAVTLSAHYTSLFTGWFTLYTVSQAGGFERPWREVIRRGVRNQFSNPVSRRWLKEYLHPGANTVRDEIREIVEAALAEEPGRGSKFLYAAILARGLDDTSCAEITFG